MSESNVALVNKCMDVLCNHVGIVEAEKFIYIIRNESFDYTKWQREHYDTMTPEEIDCALKKHSAAHPFHGKKSQMI